MASGETIYLAAGTDELVTEWVQTCKYWSARKSRQSLQGGVSNVDYGWKRITDPYHPEPHIMSDDDRASVTSGKSNLSRFNSATYGRRSYSGTAGDRIWLNDWKPPQPALMPSPLDEEAQIEALTNYSKTLCEELEEHKKLEEPMMALVSDASTIVTRTEFSIRTTRRMLRRLTPTGLPRVGTCSRKHTNITATSRPFTKLLRCDSKFKEKKSLRRACLEATQVYTGENQRKTRGLLALVRQW